MGSFFWQKTWKRLLVAYINKKINSPFLPILPADGEFLFGFCLNYELQ